MSKHPGKNNPWWILILVLIFAPGLVGILAKAAAALLLPVIAIVAVLVVVLKSNDKEKKQAQKASASKTEEEQKSRRNTGKETELKKKLSRFSRSAGLFALACVSYVVGASSALATVIALFDDPEDFPVLLAISLWFLLCGGILHIFSHFRKNRARDAQRYARLIGEKDSFSLSKLSLATSYKLKRVEKDLQRMIDAGIFGEQAYLDMANSCFMRTPDAVPDAAVPPSFAEYSRTMSGAGADIRKNASSFETAADAAETAGQDAETAALLARIRRLDDEIQDEQVSERIRRIETVTGNIFAYVKEKPEKQKQLRTFMNYYLPTTLKLLESYSRIEKVGVAGENMRQAKENIEKILDMLVAGFEQQLDRLYGAETLDIDTDIEVLEQMMKKDGLDGSADFPLDGTSRTELEDFLNSFSDEIDEENGSATQMK